MAAYKSRTTTTKSPDITLLDLEDFDIPKPNFVSKYGREPTLEEMREGVTGLYSSKEPIDSVRARIGISLRRYQNRREPVCGMYSKYKGVRRGNKTRPFRVRIAFQGTKYELGYFKDEKDAARAYDKAALKLFGEHVLTNQEYFGDLTDAV